MALAGDNHLHRQFHVAAAANPMGDPHHHIFAFAPAQTFVARQDVLLHGRRQLVAVGFQRGQFLFQIRVAVASSFWVVSAFSINSNCWSSNLKMASRAVWISWASARYSSFFLV